MAASVAYNATNRTATLTPTAALGNSKTYTIVVKSGASGVKDAAGNALAVDASSSFTTVALVDTTPPTVTSFSPAGGATNVATSTTVTVTFSEAMTASTITTSTVLLMDGSTAVAASVAYNATNRTATLTPTAALGNSKTYTIVVKSGASGVKDAAGNPLAVDASSSFTTVALVDTTPPTVTSFSPAGGATNVATSTTVTVTFSEAMTASTITTSTVLLMDGSTAVAASVSYNATNRTATLTPTAALGTAKSYTIVVKSGASGVKDAAGNALAADASSTFTTAAVAVPQVSLWNGAATPDQIDSGDTQAVELGVKIKSDVDGFITGLRFYKSSTNTGTHTASLWSASGQLLATTTFTNETASGWQQANFATPVAVTANTTYVASYHTNSGHYSVTRSYFGSTVDNGPLHALAGPYNGVYAYGTGNFPTNSYVSGNYWVDVVLSTPVDTTPPTVTSLSPASGATNVATNATVTVTFSEAMTASTINTSTVLLMDGSTAVAASVAYNATNRTATLTPAAALGTAKTYTIVVKGGASGVKDVAGNRAGLRRHLVVHHVWRYPAPRSACGATP